MSDEITSTILRQLRDKMDEFQIELRDFRSESRASQDETRGDLSILHTVLRDTAGKVVTLTRIITSKIEPTILDLVKRLVAVEKRVAAVEKKVGA